jgi:hypothetical protein
MIPLNISNPNTPDEDLQDPKPTSTAQSVVSGKEEETPKTDPKRKKRNDDFRARIEATKSYRRKLITNWSVSIDYRRGKPFSSQSDEDQIAVPIDWTYTKAKHAALFSQVPQARLDHSPDTLPKSLPWVGGFERALNDKAREAGIESTMEEVIPDCINAAGIGVGMVAYEAITSPKQVPSIDIGMLPPQLQQEILTKGSLGGHKVPMESVDTPIDYRYTIIRISPRDLLWPLGFAGSDFNKALWIGRSGKITWTEAMHRFNLKEEDKISVLGEDNLSNEKLTSDAEKDKTAGDEMVDFDELFYREFNYDDEAESFSTIHHLVFVTGKTEPVIDEAWKGQKLDQDGKVIGSFKYPIQVLTLTYLSDEAIPPSDSAIARPQVNEINKGRTQSIRQRERSVPLRWVDVNRVDPAIQQSLMRGTWQAVIPVQGDGSRVIGEVARATIPNENFAFDKVAKDDINDVYSLGQGEREMEEAKSDPNQNVSNFNSPMGKERARVGTFFCNLMEVLGCLMCLYEDSQTFGDGFDPKFSRVLKFSILTDSTVLLDSGQKLSRIGQFMEKYAKSGWINIEPCMQEIATLVGLDPSIVVQAPNPQPPAEPNISLRLTGVEDMLNPLTLAFLIKSGQAPPPELIEQAKQLIQQAVVPPQAPPPQGGGTMPDGSPVPGQPGPDGTPQGAPPPPVQGAPPPGGPIPPPPPPNVGEAHPQWSTMEGIGKRTESRGNQ